MLTGEACAVGCRLLCDVTEDGRRAVCSVLGLPFDTQFQNNWNTGSEADPQVLSQQERILRDAGVLVLPDNGSAAHLAGLIVRAHRVPHEALEPNATDDPGGLA